MNDLLASIVATLLPSLIVAVVAAYVTVRLSLKQFHSQRWWERKAQAHSDIIEQLAHLKFTFEEWLGAEFGYPLSEEAKTQLREGYRRAKLDIGKASASGAFIISDGAAEALANLRRELEEETTGDPVDHLEIRLNAISRCIGIVRECAKRDLLVK